MSTRLELVGDWRRRLADAEGSASGTSNLTWLHRMQMRLYRFLLSCYGKKDWRADKESAAVDGAREVWPDVEPSGGKPLRPIEKMRVVLTAIAKAQDHPAKAGPLQRGLFADDWMVLTSGRKIRAEEYVELLGRERVDARIVHLGRDRAVEVQAGQFHYAKAVLQRATSEKGLRRRSSAYGRVLIKRRDSQTTEKMISLLIVQAPLLALYLTAVMLLIQDWLNQLSVLPFQFDASITGPLNLVCAWMASVIVGGYKLLRPVAPLIE